MKRNKNDYEDLYEEYKESQAKTTPIANIIPGKVSCGEEDAKYFIWD